MSHFGRLLPFSTSVVSDGRHNTQPNNPACRTPKVGSFSVHSHLLCSVRDPTGLRIRSSYCEVTYRVHRLPSHLFLLVTIAHRRPPMLHSLFRSFRPPRITALYNEIRWISAPCATFSSIRGTLRLQNNITQIPQYVSLLSFDNCINPRLKLGTWFTPPHTSNGNRTISPWRLGSQRTIQVMYTPPLGNYTVDDYSNYNDHPSTSFSTSHCKSQSVVGYKPRAFVCMREPSNCYPFLRPQGYQSSERRRRRWRQEGLFREHQSLDDFQFRYRSGKCLNCDWTSSKVANYLLASKDTVGKVSRRAEMNRWVLFVRYFSGKAGKMRTAWASKLRVRHSGFDSITLKD